MLKSIKNPECWLLKNMSNINYLEMFVCTRLAFQGQILRRNNHCDCSHNYPIVVYELCKMTSLVFQLVFEQGLGYGQWERWVTV